MAVLARPPRRPEDRRRIRDLGWTRAEAREAYYRLLPFRDDWAAPDMDAYDELPPG